MSGGAVQIFNDQAELSLLTSSALLDDNNNIVEAPNFLNELDEFAVVQIAGKDYFVIDCVDNDSMQILNYDGPDINFTEYVYKKTIIYLISNGNDVYVKKINKPWQLF